MIEKKNWKRNLPMYVFGRIELSVSLAVSLWQCSPQIALNRSTCFLWMGKIGPIYIFTHRYWSQQVFLFSKWHLPKAHRNFHPDQSTIRSWTSFIFAPFCPAFWGRAASPQGRYFIFHCTLHWCRSAQDLLGQDLDIRFHLLILWRRWMLRFWTNW